MPRLRPAPPALRVTQGGLAGEPSAAQLARMARAFRRDDLVRLPGFLGPDILREAQERLSRAPWRERFVQGLHRRLEPEDPWLNVALPFLLNDPRLLRTAEAVSGVTGLTRLTGRVYRTDPGPGYYVDWHRDVEFGHRAVALVVNLGERAFRGGLLQLRHGPTGRTASHRYGAPGDAILFRLGRDLYHRGTTVTGRVPKILLASWFLKEPPGSR